MATYYKVVRVNRQGEYRSAVVNGKACLRYTLGERTLGFEGMPVLVFKDEHYARAFSRTLGARTAILAGTVARPRWQTEVCRVWKGLRGFVAFWQGQLSWPERGASPLGTYAAEWFEPKRVV